MSRREDTRRDNIERESTLREKKNRNIKRKRKKKKKWKTLICFIVFELIFTIVTAPFILLYGPFENAKRIYVGSAMTIQVAFIKKEKQLQKWPKKIMQ